MRTSGGRIFKDFMEVINPRGLLSGLEDSGLVPFANGDSVGEWVGGEGR